MLSRTRDDLLPFVRTHWRALLTLLALVLVPFGLFAHLVHEVFREGGFGWDQAVLNLYANHRTPALTRVAETLGVVGGTAVLPFVVLAIAWGLARVGGRAHAWFLVLSVSGATLLNVAAKVVFRRPRPDELLSVLAEPGFSFPSGHAMANAAFGVAIALIFWRSRAGWPATILGTLWAVAVGVSRNYLGVHYPSDVLAGWTASVAWVTGLHLLMVRRWPHLRQSPLGRQDTRTPAGPAR